MQEKLTKIENGGVVIARNIKKEKEMINSNGDVIDPETKQVIKKKEVEVTQPVEVK